MTTAAEFNAMYAELEKQIAPAKLATNQQDSYVNGVLIADFIKQNFGGTWTVDNMHRAVKALRMNGLRWDVEPKINLRDKGKLPPEDLGKVIELGTGKSKEQLQKEENERNRSEYVSAANSFQVYWRGKIEHSYSEESRNDLRQLIADCEKAGTPSEVILELVTAKVNRLQRDFESRISRNNGGR